MGPITGSRQTLTTSSDQRLANHLLRLSNLSRNPRTLLMCSACSTKSNPSSLRSNPCSSPHKTLLALRSTTKACQAMIPSPTLANSRNPRTSQLLKVTTAHNSKWLQDMVARTNLDNRRDRCNSSKKQVSSICSTDTYYIAL